MRFDPKEAERPLLAVGPCEFEVLRATEKTSKAGDPYINLMLKVRDCEGSVGTIFAMLNTAWKIKNFCETTGLLEKFNLGEITPQDCEKRRGKGTLGIERSTEHGDKNIITAYTKKVALVRPIIPGSPLTKQELSEANNEKPPHLEEVPFDDEIPF